MAIKRGLLNIILVFFTGVSAMGMGIMHSRTLEVDGIKNLTVQYSSEANEGKIEIKGLVFSSSLGIKNIKSEVVGKSLIIKVYLGVARKGVDGNLDYAVAVPSSVNEVLFGNRLKKIWEQQPVP